MDNIENTQNDLNGAAGGPLADRILSRLARENEKETGPQSEDADREDTGGEGADEFSEEAEPDGAGDAISASAMQPVEEKGDQPGEQPAKAASRARKEIEARKTKKEAVRAAHEAKGTERAARVPKEKRQPFDLAALEPEAAAVVERSIAAVHAIGRKTTENVLDLGAAFEAMAAVITDPRDWKEAVTRHCAVTVKTADNWRRVHRTLEHRREALVRNQVTPTVLIHLTAAPEAVVDEVIESFEAGRPMKVAAVLARVREDASADGAAGSADAGGAKGLKMMALAKVARQTRSVTADLKLVRTALDEAMAAAGPKRLKKGELVAALSPIAKRAHRDLTELLCDIDPTSLVGGQSLTHLAAPAERWADVLRLLYRLGGDHWAEATALKSFLVDEVLPMLAFVLDGVVPDGGEGDGVAEDDKAPDGGAGGAGAALVA